MYSTSTVISIPMVNIIGILRRHDIYNADLWTGKHRWVVNGDCWVEEIMEHYVKNLNPNKALSVRSMVGYLEETYSAYEAGGMGKLTSHIQQMLEANEEMMNELLRHITPYANEGWTRVHLDICNRAVMRLEVY